MKPTKFYGANEREAFVKVKNTLGADAVILETRRINKGGVMGVGAKTFVEVTATQNPVNFVAKDEEPVVQKNGSLFLSRAYAQPAALNDSDFEQNTSSIALKAQELKDAMSSIHNEQEQTKTKPKVEVAKKENLDGEVLNLFRNNEKLESEMKTIREMVQELVHNSQENKLQAEHESYNHLYDLLIENDVSKDLAMGLVKKMKKDCNGSPLTQDGIQEKMRSYLNRLIPEHGPLQLQEGRTSYVALIGATGVGKTTTIAKLAAIHKFQKNKKVGFITLDTYRIAAVDQLRKYAEIMDAPIEVVHKPEDFGPAIERLSDRDLVLIDTAGRNQKSEEKKKELQNYFRYTPIEEIYLVLSATGNEKNLLSNIKEFSDFPISSLIITKTDEAITFGSILSVVAKANRSVAYLTTGQEVPQDIEVSRSEMIMDLLLGRVKNNV